MSTRRRPATSYERTAENNEAADLRSRRPSRKVEIKDVRSPSPARTPNHVRHGPSPRLTFGQTRTLKGAFESTATAADEAFGDAQTNWSPPKYTMKGSSRHESPRSPGQELFEHYEVSGDVGYVDGPEEVDQLSPSPNTRQRYNVDNDRYGYDGFDFMDFIDEPGQRRRSQHAIDQQRLKRVTERDTPVLSKATVGARAKVVTMDIPPQSEEEHVDAGEFERHPEPALNIPKNWGQRGKLSRNLLDRVHRHSEKNDVENEVEQLPDPESENDVDFTAHSLQVSNSPPVRTRIGSGQPNPTPPAKMETSPGDMKQENGVAGNHGGDEFASGGSPIPNTPIVVYQNSNQDRPRTISRDDSQSLLRKLARKESPSLTNSTPEQKNVDDTISNMKTPVVMGAWVDTPAPDRGASAPEPSPPKNVASQSTSAQPVQNEPQRPAAEEQTTAQISPQKKTTKLNRRPVRRGQVELEKPDLPKSALADVIQEAKTGHDHNLTIGENTIDSIQGILNEDSNMSELKNVETLTNQVSASEKEESGSADDGAGLPKTDEAVIDRLNGKLSSLVRNIKEVRDGLSGLETQATEDATVLASRGKKPSKQSHSCRRGKACETCGLSDDGHRYIALPFPVLWRRSPRSNRVRPTLLGWILLIFFFWYISESAMCEVYCHPFYLPAGVSNFVVDPNAPRMPWVIPTMLWRWSHLSAILAPIWAVFVACFRLVGQLFGFSDGFVDTPVSHSARGQGRPLMDDVTASFARAREGYVPRYNPPVGREPPPAGGMWEPDNTGPDLSMHEDEVL